MNNVKNPYSYNSSTKNIENFTKKAVVFKKAFYISPTYSVSRSGLFTDSNNEHRNKIYGEINFMPIAVYMIPAAILGGYTGNRLNRKINEKNYTNFYKFCFFNISSPDLYCNYLIPCIYKIN